MQKRGHIEVLPAHLLPFQDCLIGTAHIEYHLPRRRRFSRGIEYLPDASHLGLAICFQDAKARSHLHSTLQPGVVPSFEQATLLDLRDDNLALRGILEAEAVLGRPPAELHLHQAPIRQEALLSHEPIGRENVCGRVEVSDEAEGGDYLGFRTTPRLTQRADKRLENVGFLLGLPQLVPLEVFAVAVADLQLRREQLAVLVSPLLGLVVRTVHEPQQVPYEVQHLGAIGPGTGAPHRPQCLVQSLVVRVGVALNLAPEGVPAELHLHPDPGA
mmetsp:Transcript_8552/g.18245  ORF Transcript_8552/g.18245 Transcript_8552/m.18245 type:complete len:272 (+) Transcript_8552:89-904(+)